MSEPKKEPTAAEAMLFFSIVKNTKNKADVDWEAVATEQGFKNSEVAKVRFGQVKRKLGISSDASTPARTPTKKGAASSTLTTPSKVAKTPRGKGKPRSKVKKEEPQYEDADDAEKSYVKAEHQNESDGEADEQLRSEMYAKVDPF
ncbi:hypothetical protein BGZ61DRAFT_450266 [Ilyonectria robusta]|uniref:uncharacterized protein n=1 Tax=Ilyonectria robusta TaxID=1079257 RepID=UPI001E8DC405|nr:uncharacterized protein BGZ61DRAFT_450266 [Ilyonectria robusta]KAH8706653.1 hypothetical protein BGZ61DRAFT_450266 [Ilyonectria robusta]